MLAGALTSEADLSRGAGVATQPTVGRVRSRVDADVVAEGLTFRTRSLPHEEAIAGGASGHETDKRSASSPPNTRLLAKGTNPDEGGSEIIIHQPGEGAVFSVGSITWVPALFTDEKVSKITNNVLKRFLSNQSRHA